MDRGRFGREARAGGCTRRRARSFPLGNVAKEGGSNTRACEFVWRRALPSQIHAVVWCLQEGAIAPGGDSDDHHRGAEDEEAARVVLEANHPATIGMMMTWKQVHSMIETRGAPNHTQSCAIIFEETMPHQYAMHAKTKLGSARRSV